MGGPTATFEVDSDGVAIITLQNPPVNALHPAVLNALFNCLREAHSRQDVKAIVVTGAKGRFSAGFDINQFAKSGGGGIDSRINDNFCALLESGPKPTVAAVESLALGGGLEVALACNARLCTPGTKLGLPELQLGILPGFGGTQRLPRLVGLQTAAQMMLTSAPINDKKAAKLGLVDAVVPADKLLAAARAWAAEIAAGTKPRNFTLYRTDKLEPLGEALPILEFARAETQKRAPHLTHPLLCLDAIRTGIEEGGLAGLRQESIAFNKAASLDTHKALVHIFFAQRATKKVRGITDGGLKPRRIKKIAVLGGGLMGSGIATASALAGIDVLLKEVNQKFLEGGLARIKSNLASRVKKGKMTQEAADAVFARVQGTLDYNDFGSVDMVIEAVIEDVGLKQRIFADLEKCCRPDCILSSNTSTIDITLIGAKTRAADRIVGAHFFSPAHIMPLLEIVRTDKTSPQVVLDTLEYGSAIKKTPVVVGNCTGFAVNRVFFPYTQAACLLVDLGLDPYKIDMAIYAGFGMPMGPFRLSDLVGADVGLHVGKNFLESFPERTYPANLIAKLNEAKRLGEKTGSGFYAYDAKRKAKPDPSLAPIVEASRKASGLYKGGKGPAMSPQDIIEFIFFPVVNEGCRVIAEGIVDKPADLDVATVLSMGFPAYRGGLIKWADLIGAARVAERLNGWAAQFEAAGLAGFFKPCDYLADAAKNGTQLGAGVSPGSRM
ncbi:Peroxisomal fatty acid beta-oxidation multifunctional protein [Coccomyxa sp. Obi]|nr:Peroxisomal fatty acid beta-oxidation multifunctional protein [Coccomyxa sp. Obi]